MQSKVGGASYFIIRLLRIAAVFLFGGVLTSGFAAGTNDGGLREGNTTLRMPSEATSNRAGQYRTVEAWGGLVFEKPVAVASAPGDTNRLFVVERAGRILVITNLASPNPRPFLDIRSEVASDWDKGKVEGLSSVAFHPGYLTNRFPLFYVTYTVRMTGPDGLNNYNRLSRFQSTRADPNQASPESERPLITQIDHGDGHNFNCLAFGSDNYLYMSAGDEGDAGTGDDFNNAQQIDKNFFSGIVRIDVDQRPGNLPPNPHPASSMNYSIPADNPWVGATNFNGHPVDPSRVRTEFYAVGLRNPWRMAFDPATGFLYEGDVGQHGREEINIIIQGGNYGWSFREGTIPGPKAPAPAGIKFIDPIYEYSPGYGPDQGFAVTGGMVYHGPSLPELEGAYIFADYVSGNVWSLRYDGSSVSEFQRLTTKTGIVGFGVDPRDGELLLIDHDQGKLLKLERDAPPAINIPETLEATGAFADLQRLTPPAGITPYDINVPFWSDGADKRRWFSLPDPAMKIGFNAVSNWLFPTGAVWIKHFELTNAVSGPVRRLETRLLVKTETGIYGVTYRWGDSKTNALLVPPEGLDEPIAVWDGGIVRTQVWRYPSRSECLACHTPAAGYALGFNTLQLNRDGPLGSARTATTNHNQIQALNAAGYFQNSVSNVHTLRALAGLGDASVSREYRVRSYLAANCISCHQPGASGYGSWDARITIPTREAGLIDGGLFNSAGNPSNRVIKPGAPELSMLLTRISQLGKDHMPPIATHVLNTEAIRLVREWIVNDLSKPAGYENWQQAFFGSASDPAAAPDQDPDHDGASNYLEYLTGRNPLDPTDPWKLAIRKTGATLEIQFAQSANRLFEVQSADDAAHPIWQPLDVPGNLPFPSASNQVGRVIDPFVNSPTKLYRVGVQEP